MSITEFTPGNEVALATLQAAHDSALAAKDAVIAELRKDAERYRWLREKVGQGNCNIELSDTDGEDWYVPDKQLLDSAIDAALEVSASPTAGSFKASAGE